MAAYLIVDIDSRDAAGMEEYRNRIPGTLAKYDGLHRGPTGDCPAGSRQRVGPAGSFKHFFVCILRILFSY
jgi:hypothetical protein